LGKQTLKRYNLVWKNLFHSIEVDDRVQWGNLKGIVKSTPKEDTKRGYGVLWEDATFVWNYYAKEHEYWKIIG